MRTVTIVGASLAGISAAKALRGDGFDGTIRMIGAEDRLPYDRPPLSKDFLTSDVDPDELHLCPSDEFGELDVDLLLGTRATALDVDSRQVWVADGTRVPFDGLVIATGAAPRRLPGTDHLAGIHTLRTVEDALAIRAAFRAGPGRVAIIGAGFIGCEVAASARSLGLDVTVAEALPQPCIRALGADVGAVFGRLHADHGVDVRLGVGVEGFDGGTHVERVRLADGSTVTADVVIVGIGVVPNTAWLEGSGLTVADGVVCDETGLAAPGITAAGDVARWTRDGVTTRLEHWDSAIAQGNAVARRLLVDTPEPSPAAVPWFWSDQYDWTLQLAGHPHPDDTVEPLTGTLGEPPFAVLYTRAGRPTAVLAVNASGVVRKARRLLAKGCTTEDLLSLAA